MQTIFSKNVVAIHEIKPVLTFDKPIDLGFSILDLSKLLIYQFHYKYIERKYINCTKLLFTDTNSLVYEIETDDDYENKNLFDFNDYLEDWNFFDPVNKKVIGIIKDEVKLKLKSKMYPLVIANNEEIKNAKDINKKHKAYWFFL